jgi:hypothetical protein
METTTRAEQESCRAIAEALDTPALEPDAARRDWASQRESLDDLWRRAERDLVPGSRAAYRAQADAGLAPADVAGLLLELFALFHAAGDAARAQQCAAHAAEVVPANHALAERIAQAPQDPATVSAMLHAHWKARHRDIDGHDDTLRRALKRASTPALKAAIKRMLEGPRPVKAPPSLVTLNGCGTMLYGSRDPWQDGSYVATRFVTAAFVPLVPLDAWRVRPGEGSTYYFLAKEPLSATVRNFRRLVLGGILALGVATQVHGWYTSPARAAEGRLDEAAAAARAHRDDEAARLYAQVMDTYAVTAPREAQRAAAEVVRRSVARIPRPATVAHEAEIRAALVGYESIPFNARGEAARGAFTDALARWEGELGGATLAALTLRSTIAHALARTAVADAARWRRAEGALEGEIARNLGAAWPLDALVHVSRSGSLEAIRQAWPMVETLLRSSSSVRFAREELTEWAITVDGGGDVWDERAARVRQGINDAVARAEDPARAQALRSGERAALAPLAAQDPGDQEVAVALLSADFAASDEARRPAVLAALEASTPFGAAVPEAQAVRVAMMFVLGRGADADPLVERLAEIRLPAMRALSAELRERQEAVVQGYLADARRGTLPADVMDRLRGASDDAQRQIFRAWVSERLGQNGALLALIARRERFNPLVGMILGRGRWLLREANERSGAARHALLEKTRGVFLSVSSESAQSAEYRLAMGQVEHQLGRPREGDALLQQVLERATPREQVTVAEVYRELGLLTRAREITERAWASASVDEEKMAIASFRSTFTTSMDDLDLWLGRADGNQPEVRIQRTVARAHRQMLDGHWTEADRLLVDARAMYRPEMLLSAAGANNAALLELQRFRCTGDVARVQAGVDGLEVSLRRAPQNATVLHNLTSPLSTLALARALDAEVHLGVLHPGETELDALALALSTGPEGSRFLTDLGAAAPLRRADALSQQLETLAPSAPRTWTRSWQIASLTRGLAEIEALRARLARAPSLDLVDDERERALAEGADARAETLRTARAMRDDADRIVAAAEAARHAPTLAAAHALRAMRRDALARAADDDAEMVRAVGDYRAAMQTWGRMDLRVDLASALLAAAAPRLGLDPTRRARFADDRRALGTTLALLRALEGDATRRDALRGAPEVTEAAALLGAVPSRHVGLALRAVLDALGLPLPPLDDAARRWIVAHEDIEARVDRGSPRRRILDPLVARLTR